MYRGPARPTVGIFEWIVCKHRDTDEDYSKVLFKNGQCGFTRRSIQESTVEIREDKETCCLGEMEACAVGTCRDAALASSL